MTIVGTDESVMVEPMEHTRGVQGQDNDGVT